MRNLLKEDNEIFEAIKEKIAYYQSMAAKYSAMLNAADTNGLLIKENNKVKGRIILERNGSHNNSDLQKLTDINISPPSNLKKRIFDDIVYDIMLENNAPMRIRELMEKYFKISGKEIERKNFSARMSIAAKGKGKVRLLTNNSGSGENKFLWCLSLWFDGDTLKEEYSSKIQNSMNID